MQHVSSKLYCLIPQQKGQLIWCLPVKTSLCWTFKNILREVSIRESLAGRHIIQIKAWFLHPTVDGTKSCTSWYVVYPCLSHYLKGLCIPGVPSTVGIQSPDNGNGTPFSSSAFLEVIGSIPRVIGSIPRWLHFHHVLKGSDVWPA